MKLYLKNTNFLTLSITALILASSADMAHSSYGSRYDGIDGDGLIDSTDEFDNFFSFFDGDNSSISFSPSEDNSSEAPPKRKRDFEEKEVLEENDKEEESIEDPNDTDLKKVKIAPGKWELSTTLAGMQRDIRGLIFQGLDYNSACALSQTCKPYNQTFKITSLQKKLVEKEAKRLFQVIDDNEQGVLKIQDFSNAVCALLLRNDSADCSSSDARHFRALCHDPIFSIDIHSEVLWKKEVQEDKNNAFLKRAILQKLAWHFKKGDDQNIQKLFLIARYASHFFSPEEDIISDNRTESLLKLSENQLIALGENMPFFTRGLLDEGVHHDILAAFFEESHSPQEIQRLGEVINTQFQNLFPNHDCSEHLDFVMPSLLLYCTPEQINFIGPHAVTFFGKNDSSQHYIEDEWKASLIEALGLCTIEQLQAITNNADQFFIDNYAEESHLGEHEDYNARGDIVELLSELSVGHINTMATYIRNGFIAGLYDATARKIAFIKERKSWLE